MLVKETIYKVHLFVKNNCTNIENRNFLCIIDNYTLINKKLFAEVSKFISSLYSTRATYGYSAEY